MMYRVARLAVVTLVLSATPALAQSTSDRTMQPGFQPGQLGVDVYTTLNPRSPAANVTQPATTDALQSSPFTLVPAATGIPANDFILYPSLTTAAFYDDNVFASSTTRISDWAYVVRPSLAWRSNNWTNAQVAGSAFIEKRWYSQQTSEDQLNGGAVVGGTVQPDANTQFVGRMQYTFAHEERGASATAGGPTSVRPISYNQIEAAGAVNRRFDRVWTSVGAAGAWIHYNDPTEIDPTTGLPLVIPQSYRNGNIVRVPARLGYVVAPLTSVFVEVSANRRNFQVDEFDSRGYRVVGGVLLEPGPGARVRGELFGGYMNQVYKGSTFQTVSTWTYGGALAFLVAPNVTAVFEGRRDAKEASLTGGFCADPANLVDPANCPATGDGVSVIETLASGRVDVRVAPNLVVGGGASYLVDEFLVPATLGTGRTDRSLSPLFSVKYFPHPNVILGFDYRYLNFRSNGVTLLPPPPTSVPSYYKNVYLFTAHWRM